MLLSSSTACGNIDEIAHLDAKSGALQNPAVSLPSGSLLTVRGWAALLEDPAGATGVFAMIDDGPAIEVVHGIERRDVAAAMDDERFAMTGFRGILSTAHLSLGQHSLRVAIRSIDGALLDLAEPASFEIVESIERRVLAAPGAPVATAMAVDEIKIGLRTGTIPIDATQGDVLHLRGWAIDEPEHAPASAVYAIVGSSVIRAHYGDARQDVVNHYHDERLRDCGFSLDIPLDDIAAGHHTIRLRVTGAHDNVVYDGHRIPLEVAPFAVAGTALPGGVAALGCVDKMAIFDALGNVVDPPAPLTLVRGNQLFLSGWAIDQAGDGIARAVHLSIDGLVSTPAVYGLERRDVAQHFHRPDLTECGFLALIATASMPAGLHWADVRVIDRTGTRFYPLEQRVHFTVIENESGA